MIKEERVIISGDIETGATVAYKNKSKRYPLVLLIMGTGTTDRDGNSRGFKTDFYKNLSDMFVNADCVCIRYDKRGTHQSTGNFKTCGLSDLVNDAAGVIDYARQLDFVDCEKIIVCGHSEGAMIATLLTKSEKLCGIILLGGACMGLEEALLYQNYLVLEQAQNKKGVLGWYLHTVLTEDRLEKQVTKLFDKAQKSPKSRYFYNGAFFSTAYMKEHSALTGNDYADMIKNFNGKVLAVTGKADVQADYSRLDAVSRFDNVTVYTPDNVNHVMRKTDSKNILGAKKEYKKTLKNDIDKGVKYAILTWLDCL